MRLLICLALMATASIAFEHEELFKENESLGTLQFYFLLFDTAHKVPHYPFIYLGYFYDQFLEMRSHRLRGWKIQS